MVFEDISYKKLQLALLEGEVDLSRLSIFQEQKMAIEKWGIHIHAGIIGTSHFVQIRTVDGRIFTELFACDVLTNNNTSPLYFAPIEKLPNNVEVGNYSFEMRKESYQEKALHIAAWSEAQVDALVNMTYHFDVTTPSLPSSRTILIINELLDDKGLRINTVHEYQEEDTIVLSESFIRY